MKVFLIIIAVIAVLIIAVCSLSATITLVYDKKWSTKLSVLFFEKEIEISKIISFLLFPERKAAEVSEKQKNKKAEKSEKKSDSSDKNAAKVTASAAEVTEEKTEKPVVSETEKKPDENMPQAKKANPIVKLWNDEGIVGILSLVSNLLETANSAILTLIRGLHIYSLYVMILVGGYDADMIGRAYGKLCQYYYPVKGLILNQMKVDNYDDVIQPDFLADRNEYEFQFIASISVGLLLKVVLKAGIVFLKNLLQNKKAK